MTLWQEYRHPTSLAEALSDLTNAPKPVVPIAGGTDLLLDMRQGRHTPAQTMLDLTGIAEMNGIEIRDESVFIGACTPINRIINHLLIHKNAQALFEACDLIAGPQVRNIATLGGNVAHALPAADGTIALVALGATAEIASRDGLRQMPIENLFLGPGKSAIDKSSELIAGFYIPIVKTGQASAFKRIMRPQGVALPILNCAVWVERDGECIKDARIAVGPGGPIPFRATDAEDTLHGQVYSEDLIAQAVTAILGQGSFRTSPRRATSQYRQHILGGLFRDTFKEAWSRTIS